MATFTYGSADYNDIYYITITTTSISATASDSTFTVTKPSITIKGHSEHSAHPNKARYYATIWTTSPSIANIRLYRTDQDRAASYLNLPVFPSQTTNTVANYSESATLPSSTSYAINTSYLFKSDNKTDRTATLYMTASGVTPVIDGSHYSQGGVTNEQRRQILATVTVTLNVPPTVELGTPTFPTPYAKIGTYTVPITSATANYGGDISKVTLTVGQDSTVKTYSSSSISSETISVTPAQAGIFTPTVTVTDSRGQETTVLLPQITITPYDFPSITLNAYRSNNTGVKDDEGTYGLITATINFSSDVTSLTQPTVKIDGTTTNNVTWYSTPPPYSSSSTPINDWSSITYSGSTPPTVYGLINGSFNKQQSYQITVTVTDSFNGTSQPITQTIPLAFYTIDFQAGGKEIAFGASADDDITDVNGKNYSDIGLFKCNMGTNFNDMTQAEINSLVESIIGSNTQYDSGWINITPVSPFRAYSASSVNAYRRVGKVVTVIGEVQPTQTLSADTTTRTIFTLPIGFRPIYNTSALMYGSSGYSWDLLIYPGGEVTCSRHRNGGTYVALENWMWLPFYATFIVAD